MFKSGSKLMEDITRMAGGTVGILNSLRQEIQEDIKERVDVMADRLDLVPRADFEKLEARIEALEKKLGVTSTAKKSSAKKKTTKKKAPAKKTAVKKKSSAKKATKKKKQ